MKFLSKRGNIPITILVIGIFVVCSLALFTFLVSDFESVNSFVGVDILQKVNSLRDEYQFYKNSGISDEKLVGIFQLKNDGSKYYFYEERNVKKFFVGGSESLLFSVKAPVP